MNNPLGDLAKRLRLSPMLTGRTWTGRRFVLVAVTLVVAALAGALVFVDWRMERIMTRMAQDAMADELAALAAIAREEGSDALPRALAVRSKLAAEHFNHLLLDPAGQRVAGDIVSWPAEVKKDGVWTRFRYIHAQGDIDEAFGVSETLPDHSRLLIATDLAAQHRAREDAYWVFAAALAGAVAVALLIGLWLDRLVIARVRQFAATADHIMAGRLNARVEIGAGQDELSTLARTLNAMLDRIEDLLTGLRAVTDSLAHDLRTPLMQLSAELDAIGGEEPSASVKNARAIAARISSTFETLIDIARAESGLSREAMAPVDIGALTEAVVELFEPLAEDRGVALTARWAPLVLNAHQALLSPAIGNLIDNAIKYGRPNGHIRVEVLNAPGGADIVVADDGPGVPAAERDIAMARFGRLARDATAQGSGLGLSIAAAAARLHGGRLRLEDNAPGLRAVLEIRSAQAA